MAKHFKFTSPLLVTNCIQRLHQLAVKRNFYFTLGSSTAHIAFSPLTVIRTDLNRCSFRLNTLCSPHSSRGLPIFLYLTVKGELKQRDSITQVQIQLSLGTPESVGEWVFLLFWYAVLVLALAGGIIGIFALPPNSRFLVTGVLLLGWALYGLMLFIVYERAVKGIPTIIYKALTAPPDSELNTSTKPPAWLDALQQER